MRSRRRLLMAASGSGGTWVPGSLTVYPSSYDQEDISVASFDTSHPVENGYTSAQSTSYASFGVVTGAGAESYIDYIFDTSPIPANAVITSVTATGKATCQNTSSKISVRRMMFMSGAVTKGYRTIGTTTSPYTIDVGTWTRAEVADARFRVFVRRSSTDPTYATTFRVYGATLVIDYMYRA